MKKHLILLIISSFLTFGFSEESEDEIQIYTIDGIDYSVNPYSQNLTALNGVSSNTKKLNSGSIGQYNLNFSIGNASPIGENLRNRYNPGFSLGFTLNTPKSFAFLNKEWNLNTHLQFSKLPSAAGNYKEINITTFSSDLTTNFGPMFFSFGLGVSPYSSSYSNGTKLDYSTFLTLTTDLGYKIYSNSQFDIILNLNFKHIMGSPKTGLGDRGTSELFGLNLKIGKSFN